MWPGRHVTGMSGQAQYPFAIVSDRTSEEHFFQNLAKPPFFKIG
jgi:hypothetical protein